MKWTSQRSSLERNDGLLDTENKTKSEKEQMSEDRPKRIRKGPGVPKRFFLTKKKKQCKWCSIAKLYYLFYIIIYIIEGEYVLNKKVFNKIILLFKYIILFYLCIIIYVMLYKVKWERLHGRIAKCYQLL